MVKYWQGKNRRQGPDKWILVFRALSIIAWILFIIAMVVSHYAAPEQNYGVVRFYRLDVPRVWQKPMTGYLYTILSFCALMSFVCIIINHFRSRRTQDLAFYNLFLLLTITIAWVIYLIFNVY